MDAKRTNGYVALRTPEEAQQLVLDVLRDHASSLLAVARRHSLCLDDAQDAYQRALEIFLRHAARLEADGAPKWVHTVVKHEAMRVRSTRQRLVPTDEADFAAHEDRHSADPGERVLSSDRVARSAEALQRLKPQEVRALWLQAQGMSYQEIADHCGWTYTKVNRCVTEGRRSFLERYADIEAGEECGRWTDALCALVDGEASAAQLAELRPHLRRCGVCRATVRELHAGRTTIAALLPVPVVATGAATEPAAAGIARLWELFAGALHDRAALTATKLQLALETASASKVAAVAAGSVALAGGVAADRVTTGDERAAATPAAAVVRVVPRSRPLPTATPAASELAASREFGSGASTAAATREFGLDQAGAASRGPAGREFGAAHRAAAPAAPGERAAVAQAEAEFGP